MEWTAGRKRLEGQIEEVRMDEWEGRKKKSEWLGRWNEGCTEGRTDGWKEDSVGGWVE
jgi:hypothetical protein